MKVTLLPSSISGTIQAIASKSFAHRQLICSSLADRETEIVCSNLSDDIRATMGCLVSLGAYADYLDGSVIVTPIASIPLKHSWTAGRAVRLTGSLSLLQRRLV